MIWQISGWTTVAADVVGSIGVVVYLTHVGRRPWSWQKKLRAPKIAAEPYYSDDPYVGVV